MMMRGSSLRWLLGSMACSVLVGCSAESGETGGQPQCKRPTCFESCLCQGREVADCQAACSSAGAGDSGSGGSGGSHEGGVDGAPSGQSGSLASNIAVSEVALYQVVNIPLMKQGAAISPLNAPVVAGRKATVRVFVSPQKGFAPRQLRAELRLSNGKALAKDRSVAAASTDAELDSTFNFEVSGSDVKLGMSYSVGLFETKTRSSPTATSGARFPKSGEQPLKVSDAGGALEIVVVPLVVNGIMPDTSLARLKQYQAHMAKLYPVAEVKVTSRPAVKLNFPVKTSSSWDAALDVLLSTRAADKPPGDTYARRLAGELLRSRVHFWQESFG